MRPLRQTTEFGTLREVVLGGTDHAAFPPKSKANATFTDHIADLGPASTRAGLRPQRRPMV